MKTTTILAILVLALGMMVWPAGVSKAEPMGTAFTYQGRLIDANNVADGLYDFEFKLFQDPNSIGFQIGPTIVVDDHDIIDGYFTVELDFGNKAFGGNARWLEIGVKPWDSKDRCTILSPRQEVTPAPYAIYAESTGGDNDWMVSGSDMYSIPSGNIGIGTTTPISSLEVVSPADTHAIRATTNFIPVYALRTSTTGTWPAVAGDCNSLATEASGVRGRILSISPGSLSAGVYGHNSGTDGNGVGVRGHHAGSGAGVYGQCDNADGRGIHGHSNSGTGVYGYSNYSTGVYGYSNYSTGVYGISNYGVAGIFVGNVQVTGNLTKGGGSFKIDHPLDPEKKYLQHSFVESPDMMNVYNGNVVLDKNGEAVVKLPEYFEALNHDFRFQLTCIGGFAPVYVAEEISENQFKIGGGKRGMKVSWQVTGIRQDAYARANPIVIEQDKLIEDHGYYLHPAAYGLPEEKGIEAMHNARFSETRQVAKSVD